MPDAGEVQEKAQQQAQQAKSQARTKAREQLDQRTTEAGERVGTTAQDVRSVAEELRNQGKDKPAEYADQAADRVERLGSYLKDADGDRMLRDVEDFAREKPWAVAAAGLALGFAASRLLKASSTERYRQTSGYDGTGEYGYSRRTEIAPARTTPVTTEPLEPAGAGRV
jgi:hypothetical protein